MAIDISGITDAILVFFYVVVFVLGCGFGSPGGRG